MTCLVTLFDWKLLVFKKTPIMIIFGIFNELLSNSKCKRSSLRSQCWMRLFLWFSNNVCILTIGTLLWLNFRVASDLDRGRKLSKRLVFLVGGVFSPSLDGIWSWWFRFFTTWKLTDPIVAVRGRIMSLGLPVKNKDFKKLSWRARLIFADLAKNWCLKR